MKILTLIHRYLSCFVAPVMLFFAITGAWQAFRLNDAAKDGTYKPAPVVQMLSEFHKASKMSGPSAIWFKTGQVIFAAAFVVTAAIGIIMAFRVVRKSWLVWLCLAARVAVPVAMAWATRVGS